MSKAAPIPNITEDKINNFWSKVSKTEDINDCWEWEGAKDNNGYGRIFLFGKLFSCHRVAHYISNSINLTDIQVLHKCDNPKCVNPNHLFLGTAKDNMIDREKKNRGNHPSGDIHWTKTNPEFLAKGKKSGRHTCKESYPLSFNAKLNEEKVLEIRRLYRTGIYNCEKISEQFKVTSALISLIVRGKIWTHVDVGVIIKPKRIRRTIKQISERQVDNL